MSWNEYIQNKYLKDYIELDKYDSNDTRGKLEKSDNTTSNFINLNDIKLRSGIIDCRFVNIKLLNWEKNNVMIEFKKNNSNFIDNIVEDIKKYYKKNVITPHNSHIYGKNFRIKNININKITYLIKYNNGINIEYIKFNPIYENFKAGLDVNEILSRNNFELLYTPIIFNPSNKKMLIIKKEKENLKYTDVKEDNVEEDNVEEDNEEEDNVEEDNEEEDKDLDNKLIVMCKINTIIVDFSRSLLKYPYIKKIFEKINANNKLKEKQFLDKIKKQEKVLIETKFNNYKTNRNNIIKSNNKLIDILLN